MQDINILKTDNTPKIILDYAHGFIELEGKSYPENTFDFYKLLLEGLTEYFNGNCQLRTTINLKLTYFNSATTQVIFDILDIVQEGKYKDLVVNWFYDKNNEDDYEDYEDYCEEFKKLNIKAIAYTDE